MRSVRRLGLVLVVAYGFGALVASSAFASPLFLSSSSGLLLASAGSDQLFRVGPQIAILCDAVKLISPGDVASGLRALSLLVTVGYENCTLDGGFITFSPVQLLVDADGLVRLESNVQISGADGCGITWPAAKNQSLSSVKIANSNNGLLLLWAIGNLTSSGGGGIVKICTDPENSLGRLLGLMRVALDGAVGSTLRWDP
jgi:hypothetical protein